MRPFDRITIFGGTSYDLVVRVPCFPGSDDKIWGDVQGQYFGGMGANVAWTYSRLGGQARLFSRVGSDTAGQACLQALTSVGVDINGVAIDGDTFETVALVDGSGEKAMVMLTPPDASPHLRPPPPKDLRAGNVVHIAVSKNAPELDTVKAWAEHGVRISLDVEPAMTNNEIGEWVSKATYLFCGEETSRRLTGNEDMATRVNRLHQLGPTHVAVTLGGNGSFVSVKGERKLELAAEPVRPVDTTGAGDCFVGAALFGIGKGWPPTQWAQVANRAAGRSTEVLGSRWNGLSLNALLDDA